MSGKEKENKNDEPYIFVLCPHCENGVMIYKKEFNCKIFRHGIYKKDNKQINPHLDKPSCDKLAETNQIYGCGKPFRIVEKEDEFVAEICGYI